MELESFWTDGMTNERNNEWMDRHTWGNSNADFKNSKLLDFYFQVSIVPSTKSKFTMGKVILINFIFKVPLEMPWNDGRILVFATHLYLPLPLYSMGTNFKLQPEKSNNLTIFNVFDTSNKNVTFRDFKWVYINR